MLFYFLYYLKFQTKLFVYQILCVHLCPGSIIKFPSKHLKLSDNRRTNVPMFLFVSGIHRRYLILYILFYTKKVFVVIILY